MKHVARLATLAVVLAVAWISWKLHPWMRPGGAVKLGGWHLADHEFQVWQRKNDSILEAFATGLFVRESSNLWRIFCLDIQDVYAPGIDLEVNGSQVMVLRKRTEIGFYDTKTAVFKRAIDGATLDAVIVTNPPPSRWWLND